MALEAYVAAGVILGVVVRYGMAYWNKRRAEAALSVVGVAPLKWDHTFTVGLLASIGGGLATAPDLLAAYVPIATERPVVAVVAAFVYAAGLGSVFNHFLTLGRA